MVVIMTFIVSVL